MELSKQQIGLGALNGGLSGLQGLGGISNQLGAVSEYQKLIERARQIPGGLLNSIHGLTRFDPSTKTRVPVTQEWVDEAVAEIVRLNVEIDGKRRDISMATPNSVTIAALEEADRIWEAVRAASAGR
jgi:hypothetical protein